MLLGAGYALKYGIDAASWAIITSAVVGLGSVAWSLYSNTTGRMVEQAAQSDDVKQVVMESAKLSDAIPSPKVISNEP